MRYDAFRDEWQAALQRARLPGHATHPAETIDASTTARRWKTHVIGLAAEPFHCGATISFAWSPFHSARTFTCEEDLVTELFGRRPLRTSQPHLVRVDINLSAGLPEGSTTPMPPPHLWTPWVYAVEEKLDGALAAPRGRKDPQPAWRGDVEIRGTTSVDGTLAVHRISVAAFDLIPVPRDFDDPRRRAREATADAVVDGLASRFRAALDAWTSSVTELGRWLRHAPDEAGASSRRRPGPAPDDGDDDSGPQTTH